MGSYQGCTDSELVAGLTSVEGSLVFSEIYERYWEKLLAIAYYHSKQRIIAEEVVQEIFIRLWQRKENLVIEDLGAYLATACKFMVYKHFAKERHRAELLDGHMIAQPIKTVDQDALIAARFLEDYLNGVVEQLPEKCKIVYKLQQEEGMTMDQIGQMLSISANTVRNHLAKARQIIKTSLKEAGHLLPFFL